MAKNQNAKNATQETVISNEIPAPAPAPATEIMPEAPAPAVTNPNPKPEPTLEDLKAAKAAAKEAANQIDDSETATDVEKAKAWKLHTDAINAINVFIEKQKKIELEKKVNEAVELAKQDILQQLNIDQAKLDELLSNATFKTSFNTVFGKPIVFAKEGETGKQKEKADGKTSLTAEIKALFDAGNTVQQVADMGYDRKRANDIHWSWKKTQA